jgi:isopentenyl phosphate kinase
VIKIDDILDDDELLDEEFSDDVDITYGTKKKLDEAVDNDDMEAEDALFMEGYMEEDE